jgi:hypothetical protein
MRRQIAVARTMTPFGIAMLLWLLLLQALCCWGTGRLLRDHPLLRLLLLNRSIRILRRANDRTRLRVLLRSLRLTPEKRSDVHQASFSSPVGARA